MRGSITACVFKRERERETMVVVTVLFQQVWDHRLSVNALMRPKEG